MKGRHLDIVNTISISTALTMSHTSNNGHFFFEKKEFSLGYAITGASVVL